MERNSRFSREPILDDGGKPTPVTIVQSDIELFKVMARYPYLNVQWLAKLTNRNADGLRWRLNQLKRKPHRYVKVADAQSETPEARRQNLYEKLCYELDINGAKVLRPLGIDVVEKTTKILDHQAMASQVMASFQLGAKGAIRLIPWTEVLGREETPAALLDNPHPYIIKNVAYRYRKESHRKDVRPDGNPFGLERDEGEHLHEFFFVGIEADCGTEPIESSEWGRSSIEKKFCEYMAVAEQQLYRAQYGFPHMYVPFIFKEPARIKSAVGLLQRFDVPMRLKRIFLFGTHSKEPSGHMVTQPWLRLTGEGPVEFTFAK